MKFNMRFYWAMFQQRLPMMLLMLLVCVGFGLVTAIKLPDVYTTSARLLVEAPQIPNSMVASTVQTNAIEQLEVLEQKVVTRANLIDIAHTYDVFEDVGQMEPDEVVGAMQRATTVHRSSGKQRATLMVISFEGRSPQIVANVVNAYVTLVLEENADFRVSRAENTLQFFRQEVERLGAELSQKSAGIASFKSEHAEALPDDQSYRLGRQTLLQERLSRLERDIKLGTVQRAEIVRIYETTGRLSNEVNRRPQTPEEQQLRAAQLELENVRAIYSETSPKVVRLQSVVDRLSAVVSNQVVGLEEDQGTPDQGLLDATLAEIDSRLDTLDTEAEDTRNELLRLQGAISMSAANGIQLAKLEREYAIIQSRHNAAVNNLNEAQMSERVESTAQGQRITVIENANVPRLPSGPDRMLIALLGAGAGLTLAASYFMLLELLNRTIRRPSELTGHFDITPISTIPYMESRRERFIRRTGLVTATLVVLVGVPVGLWYIDTHYLPLEIIVQKGLGKLGLG